jgi:ribosomal protein L7/L12
MKSIEFFGWSTGMKKIPFYRMLHHDTGIGLKEAKDIKDSIVDGDKVILEVEDSIAESIVQKSIVLGVNCHILDE